MKRHPDISERNPEKLSLVRAYGFNQSNVLAFMRLLKSILFNANGDRLIPPNLIYNVDETGFFICHKPYRILAKKGKKTVSAITSAEKGKTITSVMCVSATGNYLSPMMIFPGVRMRNELLKEVPYGAVKGVTSPSGWINSDLFYDWFTNIFIEKSNLRHDRPIQF